MIHMNDAGMKNLVCAIVAQVVKDYQIFKKAGNQYEIDALETYIQSDDFYSLSNIDGKTMLNRIQNIDVDKKVSIDIAMGNCRGRGRKRIK